jgi:hypothetical protein
MGTQSEIAGRTARFHWIKTLKVGDVVRAPSGVLRIVRSVSHHRPSIGGTYVTFLIRRPSWTNRCYTVMNGSNMAIVGYRPTGAKAKLNHEFDRTVEQCFSAVPSYNCPLHARDVKGLP